MNDDEMGGGAMSDIIYSDMPWDFDGDRFYRDLSAWCEAHNVTQTELSEAMGLNASYVSHMRRPSALPTMRNFLGLCFITDLDPRNYFYLRLPPETPDYLK